MLCTRCGTFMRDEATRCWTCGQRQTGEGAKERGHWQRCNIVHVYRVLPEALLVEHRLVAQGGEDGDTFAVAESEHWFNGGVPLHRADPKAAVALADLLARLRQEGWEVVDRGLQWYATRMGRLTGSFDTSTRSATIGE